MTSSVLGPRRSPKHFPEPNLYQEKAMFTVWWSTVGLIHYSFLNPSETITSEKYAQKIYLLFSRSVIWLFETPWTAARQVSLSFTISQSLLKLMSIESVMPSNHLIFCRPLLLLPSIFPSIRVFSNESVLHIIWPKYWSLSFSISPSNEFSGLISLRIDCFDLLAV